MKWWNQDACYEIFIGLQRHVMGVSARPGRGALQIGALRQACHPGGQAEQRGRTLSEGARVDGWWVSGGFPLKKQENLGLTMKNDDKLWFIGIYWDISGFEWIAGKMWNRKPMEIPIFHGENHGFRWRCSLQPFHWWLRLSLPGSGGTFQVNYDEFSTDGWLVGFWDQCGWEWCWIVGLTIESMFSWMLIHGGWEKYLY